MDSSNGNGNIMPRVVPLEIPEFMKNEEAKKEAAIETSLEQAKDKNSVLLETLSIVYGPRQAQYGESIDNHDRIAHIANAIKPVNDPNIYTAATIGRIMIAVKLSRLQMNTAHRDSYVDLIGYAEILQRITQRDKEIQGE